jgi:hypothetical protein
LVASAAATNARAYDWFEDVDRAGLAPVDRREELAKIAAWLEEHRGPTRLPARLADVEVQQALLPLREEQARIAEFRPIMPSSVGGVPGVHREDLREALREAQMGIPICGRKTVVRRLLAQPDTL